MNLYLLSRIDHTGYEMFHSFVVAAKSETAAREHAWGHARSHDCEDVWLSQKGSKVICIGKADMETLLEAARHRDLNCSMLNSFSADFSESGGVVAADFHHG